MNALPHGVLGVLWKPDDPERFLAIRRASGRPFEGRWTPISGRIEPGESPEKAIAREFQEETGLIVTPTDLLGSIQIHTPPFILHWWNVDPVGSIESIRLDRREADAFEWLTLNDLRVRPHFVEHPEFLSLGRYRNIRKLRPVPPKTD